MPRPYLVAAAFAGMLATGAVQAQGPLPGLPAPEPQVTAKPDCSATGVKAMEDELAQVEQLEKTAPDTIRMVCTGFNALSRFMQWKDDEPLPSAINDLAKEFLHQNLTPRMVKAMCSQVEGDAARGLRTEMGRLKDQLQQCRGI